MTAPALTVGTAYRDAVVAARAIPTEATPAARLSMSLATAAARELAAHATEPTELPCDACNAEPGEDCRPWCIARPEAAAAAIVAESAQMPPVPPVSPQLPRSARSAARRLLLAYGIREARNGGRLPELLDLHRAWLASADAAGIATRRSLHDAAGDAADYLDATGGPW